MLAEKVIEDMKKRLSEKWIGRIKAELEQVATEHLNTKDADMAMSYYYFRRIIFELPDSAAIAMHRFTVLAMMALFEIYVY